MQLREKIRVQQLVAEKNRRQKELEARYRY
jgi:hypothetical protein